MNIEDLTLRQIKDLQSIFKDSSTEGKSFLDDYIGKYVIVRTRNEGINAGTVEKISSEGLVISEARRIYYHKPKDKKMSWYEGVAMSGLSSDSKISCTVDEKVIVEDYSLTICTDKAAKLIKNHKGNEQN